jgi:hypothetical protein
MNFKVKVPLNKLNGSAIFNILKLYSKREIRALARRCGIQRSVSGDSSKGTIIMNILRATYRYDLEVNIVPR